jgi:DNA-binding FadR family transcriptional regulator
MAPVETLGLPKSPALAISRASGSDYSVDGVPSDRVAVAPERTGSGTDEVVRALTDLIVARVLTPGDPLPAEPELSTELGIGRNSLREAIRELRGIGVVEVRHGYGTFVGELPMSALTDELFFHSRVALTDGKEYLRHLFEVRESLEQGLLISDRLAPDGDRLTAILERMDAEAQLGAIDPRTDQESHEVLYQPLRNLVATPPIRQTRMRLRIAPRAPPALTANRIV